ncbi:glycosyltransferase family 2 protein [Paenarthrobacter sp. NPDC089322]|uniref:glycosyltransferase family 2 protein n=1 Tax=Paenarthrobacter sp. NPDC089322 TaxID=3155065 RepID=UPI003412F9E7
MSETASNVIGALVVAEPGADAASVERSIRSLRRAGLAPKVLSATAGLGAGIGEHAADYDPATVSVAAGVNDALSAVTQPLVLIVAAGTIVPADTAEALARSFESTPSVMVRFPHRVVRPIAPLDDDEIDAIIDGHGAARTDTVVAPARASLSAVAVPRTLLHTLRGLKPTYAELQPALQDLLRRGKQFGHVETWAAPENGVFTFTVRLHSKLGSTGKLPDFGAHTKDMFGDLRGWRSSAADGPLVSIIISTFNRADYLDDCLNSILAQSLQDFEVILIDDGSTDHTREVISAYTDPRIRYFARENHGISASRNFGADQARGAFIAVHDDDDIMLPWRLERQLESLEPGDHGSFGVSVHFDNSTGEVHRLVHRLFNMQTALRYGNNPTHPTWLIRADIFKKFRYDETLKSGVDNNIALRMVRSGIKMKHTGENLILRRLHSGQITRSAGEIQRASAKMSQRMLKFANGVAGDPTKVVASEEWLSDMAGKAFEAAVRPYLPDHLVVRSVTSNVLPERSTSSGTDLGSFTTSTPIKAWDGVLPRTNIIAGVTWPELAALRASGADFSAYEDGETSAQDILWDAVAEHTSRTSGKFTVVQSKDDFESIPDTTTEDEVSGLILGTADSASSREYLILDHNELTSGIRRINSRHGGEQAFLVTKSSRHTAKELCHALGASEEIK